MEDETFLSRHSSSRNSKLILYVCLTCFCDPPVDLFLTLTGATWSCCR